MSIGCLYYTLSNSVTQNRLDNLASKNVFAIPKMHLISNIKLLHSTYPPTDLPTLVLTWTLQSVKKLANETFLKIKKVKFKYSLDVKC